ncbi:hypothetical protein CBL_08455 [Carabus blaptoides fortunei]
MENEALMHLICSRRYGQLMKKLIVSDTIRWSRDTHLAGPPGRSSNRVKLQSVVRGGVGPDLLGGPVTLPHCSVWSTALQARPPGRFPPSAASWGRSSWEDWGAFHLLRCGASPRNHLTPEVCSKVLRKPKCMRPAFCPGGIVSAHSAADARVGKLPRCQARTTQAPLGADGPPGHPGGPHRPNGPPACSATLHQKHPQGIVDPEGSPGCPGGSHQPSGPLERNATLRQNTSRGSWNLKALQVIQVAHITLTGSKRAAQPPTKTPPEDRGT